MNSIKITFDGVEKEISLGIDSEEIESNDDDVIECSEE